MKKILLFTITIILISLNTNASHFLGNDIRMEQIGANQYKIILRIASTFGGITLNSSSVMVFEENTNTLIATKSLSLDSTRTASSTIGGTQYGFIIKYYSDTIQLANNINGYYVSSNHCCRNMVVNHTPNGGVVFTCENTNPAITGGNSNPKFVDYPDSLFMVIGMNRSLDFSCTDLDGDSLVYSIVNPFDNTSSGGSKPFNLLGYNAAFNLLNLLGPATSISINSSTGIVTARPAQLGQFVIAVKCEEYRNGVKIGQVIRDVVIPAINASFPTSINESDESMKALIYPNPNNGSFTISMEDYNGDNYNMQVTDVSGKLVYYEVLNSSQSNINLNELNKGMYFVSVSDGTNQVVKRIVVQ